MCSGWVRESTPKMHSRTATNKTFIFFGDLMQQRIIALPAIVMEEFTPINVPSGK
jgi:hypothetical protein